MTTPCSTPITRAHTLFDCTPFALALFPAFDSRKAKPGNGVHPRMVSYSPTERVGEPRFPTEAAAIKCVYMAIMSLDPTGKGRQRWSNRWKAALNAFTIAFPGRIIRSTK